MASGEMIEKTVDFASGRHSASDLIHTPIPFALGNDKPQTDTPPEGSTCHPAWTAAPYPRPLPAPSARHVNDPINFSWSHPGRWLAGCRRAASIRRGPGHRRPLRDPATWVWSVRADVRETAGEVLETVLEAGDRDTPLREAAKPRTSAFYEHCDALVVEDPCTNVPGDLPHVGGHRRFHRMTAACEVTQTRSVVGTAVRGR